MKLKSFRHNILTGKRKQVEQNAREELKKNSELWDTLEAYLKSSSSTGCSYIDYKALYDYVRQNKPVEILECGTGVSTIVIASALKENAKEGITGRVTSMEDQEKYFQIAQQLLPEHLSAYIDLRLSPRKEYSFAFFRGVGYENLPKLAYDFVFIDGPDYDAPSDGSNAFDFDFLNVVMNSSKPVFALQDSRFSTAFVLQRLFGPDKVNYDPISNLFRIGPCVQEDITALKATTNFKAAFQMNEKMLVDFDGERGRKRGPTRKKAKPA